jgi:ATP-grasp domain, R2K clade family 3
MWEPEYLWAQQQGWAMMLYDVETQRLWPTAPASIPALYRGWMLSEAEYTALAQRASLQVPLADYVASHQATGWYEVIQNFTFPSQFRPAHAAPSFSAGQRYFVKGLVKSFGADSVIDSAEQWQRLCCQHELLPEELLFVRQFVPLADDSERRFFVVAGTAYGAGKTTLPASLLPILQLLKPRLFYSLDVAITQAGVPMVVELGDGQVSDLKEWEVPDFGSTVLCALARVTQS